MELTHIFDWVGTAWLLVIALNAVFAGCSSESDGVAHTLIAIAVDAKGPTHAQTLIPVIPVPTVAPGRLDRWWCQVARQLLLPFHSVQVDRV